MCDNEKLARHVTNLRSILAFRYIDSRKELSLQKYRKTISKILLKFQFNPKNPTSMKKQTRKIITHTSKECPTSEKEKCGEEKEKGKAKPAKTKRE